MSSKKSLHPAYHNPLAQLFVRFMRRNLAWSVARLAGNQLAEGEKMKINQHEVTLPAAEIERANYYNFHSHKLICQSAVFTSASGCIGGIFKNYSDGLCVHLLGKSLNNCNVHAPLTPSARASGRPFRIVKSRFQLLTNFNRVSFSSFNLNIKRHRCREWNFFRRWSLFSLTAYCDTKFNYFFQMRSFKFSPCVSHQH